jgi:enterobacterial common antigen flippase
MQVPLSMQSAPLTETSAAPSLPVAEHVVTTYHQILRSSAIIGGASGLNMLLSFARVKAFALLLGPQGMGLMAAYMALADVARTVASMGVNHSGVRQIAAAAASGDMHSLLRTAMVLRRATLACATLGALLLVASASAISTLTFGHAGQALGVALLAGAVWLRLVGESQGALLQGMRRVGDVAKVTVWGGVWGTALAVPLIWWLGFDGIVPSLVAMAAASLGVSWWLSRRALRLLPERTDSAPTNVGVSTTAASPGARWPAETQALLRMGAAFMLSGLATLGAAYAVRLLLIQNAGLVQAGLYQAAWGVGTLLVGVVLQSMGSDFYPRLVASAACNTTSNRLVNEQTQAGLLLAGVGALATLTLAPWIIAMLYSSAFTPAVDVLRWVCLGMALRVVTWPLGYILVAQGRQALFVGVDVAWALANVALTGWLVSTLGLVGAGMAFFLAYVLHLLLVYPLARRLTGFRWSRVNAVTAAVLLALMGLVHAAFVWLPATTAMTLGVLALLGFSLHAALALTQLLGTTDTVVSGRLRTTIHRAHALRQRWSARRSGARKSNTPKSQP